MSMTAYKLKFKDADRMYWTAVVVSEPDADGFLVSFTFYKCDSGYYGEDNVQMHIVTIHEHVTDSNLSAADVWQRLAQYFVKVACAASRSAQIVDFES